MMKTKKYKKFLVITPDNYDKLIALSIPQDHLSDVEKKIVEILQNRNLSTLQRINFYRNLMLRQMTINRVSAKPSREEQLKNQEVQKQLNKLKDGESNTDPVFDEKSTENGVIDFLPRSTALDVSYIPSNASTPINQNSEEMIENLSEPEDDFDLSQAKDDLMDLIESNAANASVNLMDFKHGNSNDSGKKFVTVGDDAESSKNIDKKQPRNRADRKTPPATRSRRALLWDEYGTPK